MSHAADSKVSIADCGNHRAEKREPSEPALHCLRPFGLNSFLGNLVSRKSADPSAYRATRKVPGANRLERKRSAVPRTHFGFGGPDADLFCQPTNAGEKIGPSEIAKESLRPEYT